METPKERLARTAFVKSITGTPEFQEMRRAANETIERRHSKDPSSGLLWLGVDGDAWIFGSPISSQGLTIGDYTIDCIVEHRLRPIEAFEGGMPTEEARPVVCRITRLERTDGEPIGANEISLDLNMIAIDAVASSSHNVMVRHGTVGRWVYVLANSEDWRAAAQAVRLAAYWYGGRMKWTPAMNEQLVRHWSHLVEHGCGTATDLADSFGTTTRRVQTQLHELRRQGWVVPRGRPGRRARKDDD